MMRLDVAFAPALLADAERKVCVVIDVLRATSSLAAMFARGLDEALVAESVPEARRLASERQGWLLCGEEHGLPPEGFDYGNSPCEYAGLDLHGKRAVVATTNGTRALARAAGAPVVVTGAYLNATAAARFVAREAAVRGLDIVLICAGNGGGSLFSLEDAVCAGALLELIEREVRGLELRSSAKAALRLYRTYESPAAAFEDAEHALALRKIGLSADVAFCAQRDVFDVVPRLARTPDGSLRLVAR